MFVTSSAGKQLREIVTGNGHYNPQPSRGGYFGLGGDSCATAVEIRWPDGTTQALGAAKAGASLHVTQGGAVELLR